MNSQARPIFHRHKLTAALLLALGGCANTDGNDSPKPIASNCDGDKDCTTQKQPLEKIEAVDILLVVDDSPSIEPEAEALKEELPRMLNAIVTGSDEDSSFPPASSVHIAVASSDMGLVGIPDIMHCQGHGDDGIFIKPGDVGVSCDVSYPGYLAFEGGPAAVATVDSVGCVPLTGSMGCGFEQPLEAGLKALWPASDSSVDFLVGPDETSSLGHGDQENAGFLREDSLLVVVVVTDEDDCSSGDTSFLRPANYLDPMNPDDAELLMQGLNTRCALNADRLYETSRYVEALRDLRPDHPERVIFGVIAGVPADAVSSEALAAVDFEDDEQRDAFYTDLLARDEMQISIDDSGTEDVNDDIQAPSCADRAAMPPRRLVEVAQQFGAQSVLGSLCSEDFGATTGMLIRAIGERLTEASESPDAG